MSEIRDRSLFNPSDKKTRKQRQIEEQAQLREQKVSAGVIESEVEEEAPKTTYLPQVEVLDYEELLDELRILDHDSTGCQSSSATIR